MIVYLKSLVVLIPLIIGLIRYRKMERSYQLIVLLMLMYLINETNNFLSIKLFKTNAINFNIFSLIEGLFIFYIFHLWGFLRKQKRLFILLQVGITLLWIIENLVFLKITEFSPYYRLVYSFIIVLLSVNQINYLIIHNSKNLLRNAQFLICITFLIFFMYQIVYEVAYVIRHISPDYKTFGRTILSLFVDMNIIVNLLFAVAIFFIPEKEKLPFTLDKLD